MWALSTMLGTNCLIHGCDTALMRVTGIVIRRLLLAASITSSISGAKWLGSSDDVSSSNIIEAIKGFLAVACTEKLY